MQTRVPSPHSPTILDFCGSIAPQTSLILVRSEPPSDAAHLDCFATVAQKVAQFGGKFMTGWAIWEVPEVFVEAEFHAVWQRPDADLVDLTPRPFPCPQVLFLPDSSQTYEGRQVDNIRKSLVRDQDVIRFLFLQKSRFELLNRGALADQHGMLELTGEAALEYERLERELMRVSRRVFMRYSKDPKPQSRPRV